MDNEIKDQPICPDCGNVIDPNCCGCGESREGHNSWDVGHPFIPMGCDCARVKAIEPKAQRCAALNGTDPPQDCDAPFCGCNPEWTRCIKWLQECGWRAPEPNRG